MTKIAILDDYQNAALKSANWQALTGEDVKIFNYFIEPKKRIDALKSFDIIVLMRERTPFPKSLIEHLPNLKLLVTAGLRNLSIDMRAAREVGIDVCGTEMLGYPAFEHTWGLILALTKKIPKEDLAMKQGGWQQGYGIGLSGKTLGILGLGKLGSKVAKVELAFDMKVIAWSENLTSDCAQDVGVELVKKDDLLKESDIITIHLVLSERTRALIGKSELLTMKKSAYLINTSRGPIVNEKELIDALQKKTISGAGLDVYDNEPLPKDHQLRKLENVVLTGHTGFVVQELHQLVYGQAFEDIQAWMAGRHLRLLNG